MPVACIKGNTRKCVPGKIHLLGPDNCALQEAPAGWTSDLMPDRFWNRITVKMWIIIVKSAQEHHLKCAFPADISLWSSEAPCKLEFGHLWLSSFPSGIYNTAIAASRRDVGLHFRPRDILSELNLRTSMVSEHMASSHFCYLWISETLMVFESYFATRDYVNSPRAHDLVQI